MGIYQTNPPEDVAYILEHCHARVLFCEDQEQVDKAVEIADQTPELAQVVVFEPRGTRGYGDERLTPWEDFLEPGLQAVRGQPDWLRKQLEQLDPTTPSMVVYGSVCEML